MSPRLAAILETLFVVALAALAAVFAKVVLRDLSVFTFTWLQLGVGGLMLLGLGPLLGGMQLPRALPAGLWLKIILMGVGNLALVRLAFLTSLSHLPATTHAFLVNTVGLGTMAVSAIWFREKASSVQVIGALTALLGLGIFLANLAMPSSTLGLMAVSSGVLILAVTNNISRSVALQGAGHISSRMVATSAFVFGGLPLVAFGMFHEGLPRLPIGSWVVIIGNGLVHTVIGPVVWNRVLRHLHSFELSVLAGSSVIWAALFAMPLLGEYLVPWQWLGALVMIAGLALAQQRRATAPVEEREARGDS